MALHDLPVVDRLTLATVTQVPDWHPDHATFEPFPVHAWVIRHPDGPILVDTGIGVGNETIDEWYGAETVPITKALAGVQLAPDDITAIVLSHLHFDHCGQHAVFAAPVHVQAEEQRQAAEPHYTIAEWAAIPPPRLRLVDGDEDLADGVSIVATPGHTPGHQSVVVRSDLGSVVLGAQCAFHAPEVRDGEPAGTNLHDPSWRDAARDSLRRLRSFGPAIVHLSHDTEIVGV